MDFRSFYRLVRLNRLWILSSILMSASFAVLKHMYEPKTFLSFSVVGVSQIEKNPLNAVLGNSSQTSGFVVRVNNLIEQFKQKELCDRLAKAVLAQVEVDSDSICDSMQIEADTARQSVIVSSRLGNPYATQIIANETVAIMVDLDLIQKKRKLSDMKEFLSRQTAELGARLRSLETERTRFQSERRVISTNQAERSVVENLERNQQNALDLEVRMKTNESLIKQTQESIEKIKTLITQNGRDYSGLMLNQMQYRLNMLQYRKSNLSPEKNTKELEQVDAEIQKILEVYKANVLARDDAYTAQTIGDPIDYLKQLQISLRNLQKDHGELEVQAGMIKRAVDAKGNEIHTLASTIQHFAEIGRDIDTTGNLFLAMKKRYQEIEVEEAGIASDFTVLRPATFGVMENSPFFSKLPFTVAVGVFICMVILILRDLLSSAVRSTEEFAKYGIYSLGAVPMIPFNPLKRKILLLNQPELVLAADAFRALRFRLERQLPSVLPGVKAPAMLVAGTASNSGKTLICVNLAHSLARAGHRVIVIDLDLRNPSVGDYMPPGRGVKGLEEYKPGAQLDEFITQIDERLGVMSARSLVIDAPDLLERMNVKELIARAKERCDFVFIDGPPFFIIDTVILSSVVDCALVVAFHNKTHNDDLTAGVKSLQEMGKKPMFGVLNFVHPEIIMASGEKYYYGAELKKLGRSS